MAGRQGEPAEVARLRRELDEVRERLLASEETIRAIRDGEVDAVVAAPAGHEQVFSLLSASERQAAAELVRLAQHDPLTGLPNRMLLIDRIHHALNRRAAEKNVTALLFCDVDGFKAVNDTAGHQAGDDVLRTVAQRLSSAVRPGDTVARIGGDEFVVLCESLRDGGDASRLASRISTIVAAPLTVGSGVLEVTISIGVAVASIEADAAPGALLRDADEAMYKAKRQGPNNVELFDDQLRMVASSRLQLLSEVRHAIDDRQLRLHYQPVLSLEREAAVGVEALIRWQHPSRGLLAPADFIPFAEANGLITEIGAWTMREACQQGAAWAAVERGTRPLHVSVNVSGRQLAQGAGLVESVSLALDESGFDPTALVLEMTETALMDDPEAALRVVNELKALGVRIAIDDFGIGCSSLVYLRRLPVDLLKIDRSFVAGLGRSHGDGAIARSVIELAHAFGIAAVAEGIETRQHLAILQGLGCAYGQGHLWSAALPSTDLESNLLEVTDEPGPPNRIRAGW